MISAGCTVVVSGDQVSAGVDGEVVAMRISDGRYFALDPVGTRVWELLAEPITVAEMCRTLTEEFDVAADVCERDVVAHIEELAAARLVEVRP
jgi:hypothetical protein